MNHLGRRLRRKPAPDLPHQLADLSLRPTRRLSGERIAVQGRDIRVQVDDGETGHTGCEERDDA